ncbi:MAG: branched-chain amino acid ABC transporter permease, partial [Nitrospinota bacterium]
SIRYMSGAIDAGGLTLSIPRLVAFGMAALITAAAFLFLKKTRTGKAIRATAQSRDMAMACGVNIRQIHLITFGIGAGLAAASGSLMTLMYSIYPEMGMDYTMKSFIIIILGGMGSYVGALVGALILGLVESLGSLVFSMEAGTALTYVLLLVVLVAMPAGLAGWRRTS